MSYNYYRTMLKIYNYYKTTFKKMGRKGKKKYQL